MHRDTRRGLNGTRRLQLDGLLVVACALTVMSVAVIQHVQVLGVPFHAIRPHFLLIPLAVGTFFGVILARQLRVQERQRRLASDIAAREKEIRELNRDLEDKVEERTQALRVKDEQLLQAQKMEAIGRLAGGLAHDFNNLLTVIVGSSDFLTFKLVRGSREHKLATDILSAGERASALTRQLLVFSRGQPTNHQAFDASAALSELRPLLERLAGARCTLEVQVQPGLHLDCGRLRFEQVVMNLVLNARDATHAAGTIGVRLATNDSRGMVRLDVQDDGEGMRPEVQAHIFEPFFSTKASGSGTGLGLAVVHGVVEGCSGHIELQSEPGVGTTLSIYFPRVEAPMIDPEEQDQAPRGASPNREGCVLVVEDDETLRRFLGEVLGEQGYRVKTARGQQDALLQLDHCGDDLNLLLTDLVLPDGSGVEVAKAVRAREQGARILLMTGFAHSEVKQELEGLPHTPILTKPFTTEQLLAAVDEILAARTRPGTG